MIPSPDSTPPRVSALVITYNEERNLGDCLASLEWCDEIVVVDSYSTDATAEIARAHPKVRFLQREYFGAASAKNWGMLQTRHEWTFQVDADERCTPELRDEITALLAEGPKADVYVVRRRVWFLDREMKHSGWRNDRVARLLRRKSGRYENRRVHPRILTRDGSRAIDSCPVLRHRLEHYMVDSLGEYIERIRRYGYWGAAQWWREGRRTNGLEIFYRPTWRFLRAYFLQLGFLDGAYGLTSSMLQAFGTYVKVATLWGWQVNARRGTEPRLPAFDEDERVWSKPRPEVAPLPLREHEIEPAVHEPEMGPVRTSAGIQSAR